MNVFISSVVKGMETYRDAVAEGISTLDHVPKRSEDYGASPESSQTVCLQGVRDADCVVLILGDDYGRVQESGLSATHEEYREARERKDVLAFLKRDVSPDGREEAFIREVRNWATGQAIDEFGDELELKDLVIKELANLQVSRAKSKLDPDELIRRSEELRTGELRLQAPMVALVVVPGPWETVIPPTLMDNSGFRAKLQQSLSFGDQPIFNRLAETAERIDSEMLVLEQDGARFAVDERGAMRIDQKLVDGKEHFLPVIVEEHIISAIEAALRFAGWLLDEVDEVRRVSDVAIAAGLVNCRSYAWRTLAEDQASGGSVTMSNLGESHFIEPSRHVSKRSGLLHDTDALVEDIVARLRRAVKNGG